MSNKKTAVNWLIDQLAEKQNGNGSSISMDDLFKHAKQMEKEQIKNAWLSAWKDSMLNPLEDRFYEPDAEQYYKETYES